MKLLVEMTAAGYGVGLFWNELVGEKYVERSGLGSAETWWDAHLGSHCKARTAESCGRVVKKGFDEKTIEELGVPELDQLITYCHHERIKVPKDPRALPIHFITEDGKAVEKPFSQCLYTEMLLAAHPKHDKPPPPGPSGKLTKNQEAWLAAGRNVLNGLVYPESPDGHLTVEWIKSRLTYALRMPPELQSAAYFALDAAAKTFEQENGPLK